LIGVGVFLLPAISSLLEFDPGNEEGTATASGLLVFPLVLLIVLITRALPATKVFLITSLTAFIVLLFALLPWLRKLVAPLSAFFGAYTGNDVSLTSRSFEYDVVASRVFENTLTALLGLGPGGVIPGLQPGRIDAGPDVLLRDDVHLITAYLLFKLGLLGLLWGLALLVINVRLVFQAARASRSILLLSLFPISSLVVTAGAATHLLRGVVAGLILGYLMQWWKSNTSPGLTSWRSSPSRNYSSSVPWRKSHSSEAPSTVRTSYDQKASKAPDGANQSRVYFDTSKSRGTWITKGHVE
jgi:hypothetical protein